MKRQIIPLLHGSLTVQAAGDRAELRLDWFPPEPGLYRGYLTGPRGRTDLGLLLPEGGCLRAARSFSVPELDRRGCWPVTGGGADLSHPFSGQEPSPGSARWSSLSDPEALFPRDPVLARAMGEIPDRAVCREADGGFCIAIPWDPSRPFPLTAVFCFARVRIRSGRLRIVYSFRPDGRPCLPQPCQEGKTEL